MATKFYMFYCSTVNADVFGIILYDMGRAWAKIIRKSSCPSVGTFKHGANRLVCFGDVKVLRRRYFRLVAKLLAPVGAQVV